MAAITTYSEPEKKRLYKRVVKDLKAVEKEHGIEEVRWAMNRLTDERKRKQALEKRKREVEDELERLNQSG